MTEDISIYKYYIRNLLYSNFIIFVIWIFKLNAKVTVLMSIKKFYYYFRGISFCFNEKQSRHLLIK